MYRERKRMVDDDGPRKGKRDGARKCDVYQLFVVRA